MKLNVENKTPIFYELEKTILNKNTGYFLYELKYDKKDKKITILVGPINSDGERVKWKFSDVKNFKQFFDDQDKNEKDYPKMILAIDSPADNIITIACDDTEFSFSYSNLFKQSE